jgi:hypothetical protein
VPLAPTQLRSGGYSVVVSPPDGQSTLFCGDIR